jgi:MarR family transcriptional regulator, transcriptional regulator for hemolysin
MKPQVDIIRTQAPLGYLIHEVAKLLKRRFEDEAKSHGITLPQWRALAHIALHEGITQRALADAIDADPMTVSGILDRLEKRGLIDRYPAPSDSRAKLARLTAEGDEMFRKARATGLAMYQAATEGLSANEREAMKSALCKMRDNLSGQPVELEEV